ncbi:MAG: methylmalonyl Co-A mutase-associated GTPase MeaB [Chlorobi bacterium]|nr:methylmalonyl Co-A mutase-associated GTPase MeaB [Chlorobiota bacterium]
MKKQSKSSLSVKKGVKNVKSFGEKSVSDFKKNKKKEMPVNFYLNGIRAGDITILSQAITLVESAKKEHKEKAQEIIKQCLQLSGNSVRIGITGVPGVGKSTFIETLGMFLLKKGKKIAVLAIDPSSERSGGSILGDKTRMEKLSVEKNAFIRPSPSAGSLGGVARKTAETIILCEAAGFDTVLIETVGVGQSEIAVSSMVDFFMLLMLAGAGDELQGIKRGIMEMADLIVINKADGDNMPNALRAKAEYQNALHLFPPTSSGWEPKVVTASAQTGNGIAGTYKLTEDYLKLTKDNRYFTKKRHLQAKYRMYETINEELKNRFYNNSDTAKKIKETEKDVLAGKISPYAAAQILLDKF